MLKTQRKLILGLKLGLVIAVGFLATRPAYCLSVGIVDVQKVLEQSSAGKRIREILQKEVQARQELITKKQTDLKGKKENFDKNALMLNPDKKLEKQGQLEQEFMEFQKFVQQSDSEMQRRQVELMQPVLEDIKGRVQEIGAKDKYDIVLEKNSGVLYTKSAENITDRVILMLEQKSPAATADISKKK